MEKIEEILLNEVKTLISGVRGELYSLYLLPELVLSIIHKINNKMTPLLGYTQLLMKDSEGPTQEKLKRIFNSGSTVSTILSSLFEYLKTFPYPKRICDLGEFVKEVIEEDERLKNIDFKFQKDEIINLPINKVQMREAIKRVIDNSLEALDKPEKRIEILVSKEENNAVIEIWDNGEGIDAENLNNIFEPFFTTKTGKVGLGLSYVHGIVKNHGGDVRADSEKGKWTKVKISLPITPFEWKEEKVLLLAPENEFYKIFFKIAEFESINIEWKKDAEDIEKYTHIILDEDYKDKEKVLELAEKFKRKVIFLGKEERKGVLFLRKPATILRILSSLNL